MEHEGDGNTNYNWCALNGPKSFVKRLEELDIRLRIGIFQTIA